MALRRSRRGRERPGISDSLLPLLDRDIATASPINIRPELFARDTPSDDRLNLRAVMYWDSSRTPVIDDLRRLSHQGSEARKTSSQFDRVV